MPCILTLIPVEVITRFIVVIVLPYVLSSQRAREEWKEVCGRLKDSSRERERASFWIGHQVGLSLTIPMTIVTDVVRRNPLYVWDFIAAVCVIAGFLSIALSPEKGSEVKPSELLTNEHEEVVDGTPQY